VDCHQTAYFLPRTWDTIVGNNQADPRPVGHDPTTVLVSKQFSLKSRIHSARVAFLLLSFLCTKSLVEGLSELGEDEKFLIFDAYLKLEEYQDPSFWTGDRIRKWKVFETIIGLIRNDSMSLKDPIPRKAMLEFYSVIQRNLPGPHAYFGWRKNFRVRNFLVRRNRALDRKAPPKRFVGVGYRDKGNAGDSAYDASPSWQEVACAVISDSFPSQRKLQPVKYWSELNKRERIFLR